jgi:hypothetical protein
MSAEALTAEQPPNLDYEESALPLVIPISETTAEKVARRQSAGFIGSVIAGHELETPEEIEEPFNSLYDAAEAAAKGSTEARKLIKLNAKTAIIEQTIITGHVGDKIPLFFTSQGELVQHNQSLSSVHANGIKVNEKDPIMLPRTKAEARNKFRTEVLNEQGYFDAGYSMVVISLAEHHPEFFEETMTCAIQVTSKSEDGLTTEPAFVSGIKEPGGEEHDMETAVKLFDELGIDIRGMTRAEIIDTPILIHNSLIPDGAINMVERWDDCAGGTFFGENRPRQNYLDYLQACAELEKRFDPKAEKTTEQIITKHHLIDTDREATEMLHGLVESNMVEQAVGDTDIDPRVFGPESQRYIEQARAAYYAGDAEHLLIYMDKAKQTANTLSCPGGGFGSATSTDSEQTGSSFSRVCEFTSKKCPECGEENVKTWVSESEATETVTIRGSCGCVVTRSKES